VLTNPPFGQADLTNCERELIHLAGSVQPHGLLLALREPDLRIAMASANVRELLGVDVESLLNQPLAELGGDIKASVQRACTQDADLSEPAPLRCRLNALGQRLVQQAFDIDPEQLTHIRARHRDAQLRLAQRQQQPVRLHRACQVDQLTFAVREVGLAEGRVGEH
jgi:hypothetical protein